MSIKLLFEPFSNKDKTDEFSKIYIKLASPEVIRKWSYGEVKKPETINYKTYKPEFDGLFCERIFGPVKDYECACGKYKRIRYKGIICDKCGVEVTTHRVRRERMGHIELAIPVVHIWFYTNTPSIIATLLNITSKALEQVIYYEAYIVTDPGNAPLKRLQLLTEEEYEELREQGYEFEALMGGEAIKKLLQEIELEKEVIDLKTKIELEQSEQKRQVLLKRLKVIDRLRHSGNRPEWMVYEVLPVLPPELRPLVPLEGGRFASSDLNDLYRRVINRNNRLKKLIEIDAPDIILRNEKRMLQEAVDALIDNGKRKFVYKGENRRPLKSLSEMLKGKKGRFRQNLLGKRVDYSGRSVIVVGPELKIFEAGVPKVMALELFKPFVIAKLEEKGYSQSIRVAKRMIAEESEEIWEILEEILEDHPILLNRAPTLHRVSIQAFYVKLTDDLAIRLSPFVCSAFNADFDGDQMAIHVPLSFEAQFEARIIMLSSNNTLSPASGRPLAVPSQDTVLGSYYLTKVKEKAKGEGKKFSSFEEATFAYENGIISLHAKIFVKVRDKVIETTYGRLVFNSIVPESIDFINDEMTKKKLTALVYEVYSKESHTRYIKFLDDLKDLGFEWATRSGISLGIDDIEVPEEKQKLIEESLKEVEEIKESYEMGFMTERERYSRIIDIWTHTTNRITEHLMKHLEKSRDGFNPLWMMAHSGARGSKEQIRQLAGMRGLMAKPKKKLTEEAIVENPIISNFKEGLNVLEYFISTHGARKGLADTALKTADAGYLTRRLVDVAQDLIVTEHDCGTIRGIKVSVIKQGDEIVVPLSERIEGRFVLKDIYHPITGEVIVASGELITKEKAKKIEEAGIESVMVRSVLTCESKYGICQKCYGIFPGTGKLAEIGDAVGVIAAQSIGEPGTQLTLRTFHVGGTAARIAAEREISSKTDGIVKLENIEIVQNKDGKKIVLNRNGELSIIDENTNLEKTKIELPMGAILFVEDGQKVKEGQKLYEWDPYNIPIITDVKGKVVFKNLIENDTYQVEKDETTNIEEWVIIEYKDRFPYIEIVDEDGEVIKTYSLPVGARLAVKDGQEVYPGDILAKLPRESGKTTDITGGLPRVAELFEAKESENKAIIAEVDGIVHIKEIVRRQRKIEIVDEEGNVHEYFIPAGRHILVYDGHKVKAGEKLCEGPVSPHDILKIKGINAVQEFLLNEIQDVYRIQGVSINDKHIECIIRQMMKKVRITKSNDTQFLEGDFVDRHIVLEENKKVLAEGKRPAEYEPVLLGITKTALMTESFISAASFQETSRVLTNAAISGKVDELRGLKENVIIGRLIPAGTGNKRYKNIKLVDEIEQTDVEEEIGSFGGEEENFNDF